MSPLLHDAAPLRPASGPAAAPPEPSAEADLSRRGFLALGTSAVAATMLPPGAEGAGRAPAGSQGAAAAPAASLAPALAKVSFTVNGEPCDLELDTRTTLLDALREHLHLTGSKKGCDQGQCGACTVIVNGRRINSCLTLAIMQQGAEITTIEGLGDPEHLHPLQEAFVKCDGYQCGYCTAGQICSAVAMLGEVKAGIPSHVTADLTKAPRLTPAEVRERMSGNLCRCGAYSNIFDAITQVAENRAGDSAAAGAAAGGKTAVASGAGDLAPKGGPQP